MGWKINALTLLFYKSFVFQDIAQGTSNNYEHFAVEVYLRNTAKFIFFQNTSKLTRLRYNSWGRATSTRSEYQYAIYGHSTFYIELKISFQFMFQAQYEELSLKYIPRKTFDNQILTDPSPPTPLHIMEFYACFMVFLFLKASLS